MKWIASLALIALLGVAFWQFSASDSALEAGAGAAGPVPQQQAESARGAELVAGAEEAAGQVERVETSALQPSPEPAGAPRAAGAPADGPKLTGRVVDDRGRPVAGARVAGERGQGVVRYSGPGSGGPGATVRTDVQGRFELPVERDSALDRIGVLADGFEPLQVSRPELGARAELELGDLRLTPGPVLEGLVLDADGRPVEGARLSLRDQGDLIDLDGNAVPDALTDADGAFRLGSVRLGEYALRVESERHPARTFQGFTDTPGRQAEPLRLQLERAATIAGIAQGLPEGAVGYRVQSSRVRAKNGLLDFESMADRRSVELSGDGTFLLEGLVAEREYELVVVLGDDGDSPPAALMGGRERSKTVRARAGARGVLLNVVGGARLSVNVVDAATDEPLEDVDVHFGPEWNRVLQGSSWPGGRIELTELDRAPEFGFGGGSRLELGAEGYQTQVLTELELVPGETLELGTVRLSGAPMVRVRVFDRETNEPLEGARVELAPADEQRGVFRVAVSSRADGDEPDFVPGGGARRVRTDDSGRAELTGFPGQRVVLTVGKSRYSEYRLGPEVLSAAGDTELEVPLERGAEVLVTVVDPGGQPIPGMQVEHREAADSSASAGTLSEQILIPGGGQVELTDAEGRARFTDLAAGRHAFRATAPPQDTGGLLFAGGGGASGGRDADWRELEVRAGGRFELELRAEALIAVTGQVLEAGVPLAGAGIEVKPASEDSAPGAVAWGGMAGGGLRTNSEGRWTQDGLEPGGYTLVVTHPRRAMPDELAFELTRDGQVVDVNLQLTIVSGRVTDGDGRPVVGARVSATSAAAGSGPRAISLFMTTGGGGGAAIVGQDQSSALTDADGRYELRGVRGDTPLQVRVEPPSEGPLLSPGSVSDVEVPAGEVRSGVDVVLEQGAAIEVRLIDAAGEPASGYLLTARREAGQPPRVEFIQDGSASLRGLAAGTWTLRVQEMLGGGGEPQEQVVELPAGESLEVSFEVP